MMDVQDRRRFLQTAGMAFAGTSMPALSGNALADEKEEKGEEVTAVEDLGREHGLLNRVLLIYDESERRLIAKADFDVKYVADSAQIIRKFIEEYHEKEEEDFLFPRFEKAHKLTDLVTVLRRQHDAGRRVTSQILQLADGNPKPNSPERQKLVQSLSSFVHMYRPHEAREDTVLFPEVRKIISSQEYDALGEEFEKREHQIFGGDGFEMMLAKVADIERGMGIYDLRQFTPA